MSEIHQTPAHERHNPDLLALIPREAKDLIEIGCSSGALARELKKQNSHIRYLGMEIDTGYAELARRHCDEVLCLNLEDAAPEFWENQRTRDCWIFGDVLEHLYDPWRILNKIHNVIPANGSVVACIPNMQHWSIQARLSLGNLNYEDSGLLDRTHIRWFTRSTMIQMFSQAGFEITAGTPRIFPEPARDGFLPQIRAMAIAAGGDPNQAVKDAMVLQFVIKAQPKKPHVATFPEKAEVS